MNPHTGAVYPDLGVAIANGEDPENLIEISGEREAVAEAIEALQDRARSRGEYDPSRGMSARQIRRQLEREGR